MGSAEGATATSPLGQFVATMESLGIEPGSRRIDAFLGLPEQVQDAIWAELARVSEAGVEEGAT